MEHKAATGHPEGSPLKEAAKAIGSVAGTLAAIAKSVVAHGEATISQKKKTPKLPAKHKARLPRREKKRMAAKKAA
jgi:hypothetical protein